MLCGLRFVPGGLVAGVVGHDGVVFFRVVDRDIQFAAGPEAAIHTASLLPFSSVSRARWCAVHHHIVATASPAGRALPNALDNERGDLRLFGCDPREGVWRQIYRGYAHDPLCLPDGGYVVHRGAGLTILDSDGAVRRQVKVGRFNWGAPSLSLSPDGTRVAWCRWHGGDRKPRLDWLAEDRWTQFRTSVHRYCWLDPDTLLYKHGNRVRLLDCCTGTTRAFGASLRRHVQRGTVTGATDLLYRLAELPSDQIFEFYGEIAVVGDDVWISATLTARQGPDRVDGLYRTDRTGTQLHLVATVAAGERIEGFTALPDRSALIDIAVYEQFTIVDRHRAATGPLATFLSDGWTPMPTSHEVAFAQPGLSPRRHLTDAVALSVH